jgi:phospholipase D-like protein
MSKKAKVRSYTMRIQARPGSPVEKLYYTQSALPGTPWPTPKVISPGISPSPLDDLIFHGGKTVPQMGFRNIYLGSRSDWALPDVQLIEAAIERAMQDRSLNNVIVQYFTRSPISCDKLEPIFLSDAKPDVLDEPDVQQKIVALFEAKKLGQLDLDKTIFNLLLPPGTTLNLGDASSQNGLGGYHGSVRTKGQKAGITLYYSANVFSQVLNARENGIVAFDQPWKNVVATLYHELNEFRTDPDVHQAITEQNNDLLGWASRQGRECGDQPIFVATSLNQVFQEVTADDGGPRIPIQFMYSNTVHGAEGPIDSPDAETGAAAPGRVSGPSASPAYAMPSETAIDQSIVRHIAELSKPGVLSIRPGYQMAGGWLTKKPAIVVTVDQKHDDLRPEDRLPETLDGYSVDVRQADNLQRLRATNPLLHAEVLKSVRPELIPATFPLERDQSGHLFTPVQPAASAGNLNLQIRYTPPPNAPLDPIEDNFTISCHASPDAGWTQLEPFLSNVRNTLTVGMYQCTSAHILSTLQASLTGRKAFNLIMDHPAKDRTQDQSDDDTRAALEQSLRGRLQFAWALEGKNLALVTHWIYPFAYHIKVAVRDSRDFWLSSGNWNNSNQPDIDPISDPASARPTLSKSDRDWHVIVEHPGLASLLEKYLLHDLQVASQNQGSAVSQAALSALAALGEPEIDSVAKIPAQFFAPKTISNRMKIQPLLTPDNYGAVILNLINSAEKSLFMQIPYITPSSGSDGLVLAGLIEAIARQMRSGIDVRLILSSFEKPGALEQLQAAGIDLSRVHIQNNLHNKGIIVDSSIVAVGSQNWSGSGVSTNRDATLVIFNEEAAQYWETIFIHDWLHMSSQQMT